MERWEAEQKGIGGYQNLSDENRFLLWNVSQRFFHLFFFPVENLVFVTDISERVLFVWYFILRGKIHFSDKSCQIKKVGQSCRFSLREILCCLYAVRKASQDGCQRRTGLCIHPAVFDTDEVQMCTSASDLQLWDEAYGPPVIENISFFFFFLCMYIFPIWWSSWPS